MAIIHIRKDSNDKLTMEIIKHDGEKETDNTYIHAKNALVDAVEFNFMDIESYPYTKDVTTSIHFLSKSIIINNKLDQNGLVDLNYSYSTDSIDPIDFNYFLENGDEYSTIDNFNRLLLNENNNDVIVLLDSHMAAQLVGGFFTPSFKTGHILYSYLKEKAKKHINITH